MMRLKREEIEDRDNIQNETNGIWARQGPCSWPRVERHIKRVDEG